MQQMSLSFEPGLSQRHRSLLECVATGIYQRGLGRIAGIVDQAPSNLSAQLSGDGRHLSVETLELYIEKTGDLSPVYYLIDKYLSDPRARQVEALARVEALLADLPGALNAAGLAGLAKGRR